MYAGNSSTTTKTLLAIARASLANRIFVSPLPHSISSSIVLSEDPSHVSCSGLLECTSSQSHIKIPTTHCLWLSERAPLFSVIRPRQHKLHSYSPTDQRQRSPDACAALTGVSSVHHPEGEREAQGEGKRELRRGYSNVR